MDSVERQIVKDILDAFDKDLEARLGVTFDREIHYLSEAEVEDMLARALRLPEVAKAIHKAKQEC